MAYEKMAKSFDAIMKDYNWRNRTADSVIQELNESFNIQKAIGTGESSMPATFASGENIRIQNLDSLMTSVLFEEQHLVLWNWLPRVPSINYKYEWTQRDRYGSARHFPGFVEGGNPTGSTSAWTRKSADIRWLGVKGGITHQQAHTGRLGGAQIDPEQEENRNRTLELLNM